MAVLLSTAKNMVFNNCTFVDSVGTAISAIQSNVIFEGNVTFKNNTGINGVLKFLLKLQEPMDSEQFDS